MADLTYKRSHTNRENQYAENEQYGERNKLAIPDQGGLESSAYDHKEVSVRPHEDRSEAASL